MYKMMTPGPSQVRENVLLARSKQFQNPDLDSDFVEYYHDTCKLYSSLLHTENESLILGGEGILGLEAACASLTEPGDRVLVLDNGVFGEGFKDFVSMYGGTPILYTRDYSRPFDMDDLKNYLEKDHDFKYATVVHCDTPSGMLNDIASICTLLKSYSILTVVDSVAGMFGEDVRVDDWKIDLLCGGSQKAVSAPPGLTMVTISADEAKWFPYTMPVSDIYGLRTALENIKADPQMLERHAKVAAYTRKAVTAMGLKLYPESGYSNTVTTFQVPEGHTAEEILHAMRYEHNILLAGSFGCFAGKLIRIGHMGENAYMEKVQEVLDALQEVLKK